MVKITWTADGLWAWLANNPGTLRRERVYAILRKAQKQTLTEWTQMRASGVGLAMRFDPQSAALLGLTQRSPKYREQQRRTLGGIFPYVAPLSRGRLQLSPSGTMRRAVLGGGFGIASKNTGGEVVTTQITVTGARILNYNNSPNAALYRREFLGFDVGGRRDAEWIKRRGNELAGPALLMEIQRANRRTIIAYGAELDALTAGNA